MDLLPLFPLGLIAFPHEQLNLHIFEPRYKQLINDCKKQQKPFGIPAYIDKKLLPIGTQMRLLSIEKSYADGRLDIKTLGLGKFKIKKFYNTAPNKLYAAGEVSMIQDLETDIPTSLKEEVHGKLKELYRLIKIDKNIPDISMLKAYDICHYLGLDLLQKYDLLKMDSEKRRLQYISLHLEQMLPMVLRTEELKNRVQMNGHFKNIKPPEF